MTKTIFMDKYPVFSLNIKKTETNYENVSQIIEHFNNLIEEHPIAKFIAIFDHYEHTSSIQDSVIADEIKDAKNIIFCFGKQLPTSKMLAVRPRSIGVCEFEDSFEISFLEVPNEQLHTVTEGWARSVVNK
ncbi:DUF6858 family protein [Sulfurimonas sp.]|uniref:DUF6858 family protein n=1 Tax=Sulfurimonas sp. TaxID=2022749 RepID=UPI002603E0EE|nr:hypothetical protein [Sulfurimonas sp.]